MVGAQELEAGETVIGDLDTDGRDYYSIDADEDAEDEGRLHVRLRWSGSVDFGAQLLVFNDAGQERARLTFREEHKGDDVTIPNIVVEDGETYYIAFTAFSEPAGEERADEYELEVYFDD